MVNLFALFSDSFSALLTNPLIDAFNCFFAHNPTDHAVKQMEKYVPPQILNEFYSAMPMARVSQLTPQCRAAAERAKLLPIALRQSIIVKALRGPRFCSSSSEVFKFSLERFEHLALPDHTTIPILFIEICKALDVYQLDSAPLTHLVRVFGREYHFSRIVQIFLETFKDAGNIFSYTVGISTHDRRPILVPSPTIPFKFISLLGAMLVYAVTFDLHVPFLLEWAFFKLAFSEFPKPRKDPPYLASMLHSIAKNDALLYLVRAEYSTANNSHLMELEEIEAVIRTGKRGKLKEGNTLALNGLLRDRDNRNQKQLGKVFGTKCNYAWLLSPSELYELIFKVPIENTAITTALQSSA
jgi:hypothetical protein